MFTPTRPARVAFVERDAINNKLVNAIETPGKQIVVYGHSGSGKTTLLVNKLHQLYEHHLTTRCMRGVTFDQLILDAFDQLAPYYVTERANGGPSRRTNALSASYQAISVTLSSSATTHGESATEARVLPPQLTPQNLARFMGAAGLCWVLEDFHKIDDAEKPRLSQLMKVFMDMSDEYIELKIIALGAVDTARQVVDYDPEMKNRVAEIRVDLMERSEIDEIIRKGEEALNISFSPRVKDAIASYSNGLASVCHHLCLNICDAAGIRQTCEVQQKVPPDTLHEALKLYVQEASDSIKSAFDLALKKPRKGKFDNAELIFKALYKMGEEGAARADLLRKICEAHPSYPNSNLELYLKKLQLEEYGALIRFSPLTGRYSFADPFYRVFAMVMYEHGAEGQTTETDLTSELERLLKKLVHVERNGKHFVLKISKQ